MKQNQIVFVPIEKIKLNRYQVEGLRDQATVLEIKSSLLQNKDNGANGLSQIPRARQLPDGTFEQAFGRHRFFAFEELLADGHREFKEMPLLVSDMTDVEMFEQMGIDILQHRDISPNEEAHVFHIYMTAFGKNSVETGQKFEKTDEYVRQAIRLINLPESVLKLLDEGKLTKSSARDLLVVQKLGGVGLVKDALEEIERDKFEFPQQSIEDVLTTSPDVSRLFFSGDAGWTKAKKFPVKYLEPLTTSDLETVLEQNKKGWSREKEDAAKNIKQLISAGMEVTDEAFPMVSHDQLEKVRVLANPPACETCPLHAVLDGDHYCGFQMCRKRKENAWKKKEFEEKVKGIGIPLYQSSDGETFDLNHRNEQHLKLFKAKHADLRLMKARGMWSNYQGLDQGLKVVAIGDTAEKQKKAQTTAVSKGDRESVSRDLQREIDGLAEEYMNRFQWDVASHSFGSVLDGVTSLDYLKYHFGDATSSEHNGNYPPGLDEDQLFDQALTFKKADALKQLRRMIMFNALESRLPGIDHKKPVIKLADECQKIAEQWGVKLPKDFTKQAEKYQAELDAALKQLGKK